MKLLLRGSQFISIAKRVGLGAPRQLAVILCTSEFIGSLESILMSFRYDYNPNVAKEILSAERPQVRFYSPQWRMMTEYRRFIDATKSGRLERIDILDERKHKQHIYIRLFVILFILLNKIKFSNLYHLRSSLYYFVLGERGKF